MPGVPCSAPLCESLAPDNVGQCAMSALTREQGCGQRESEGRGDDDAERMRTGRVNTEICHVSGSD